VFSAALRFIYFYAVFTAETQSTQSSRRETFNLGHYRLTSEPRVLNWKCATTYDPVVFR